MVLGILCWGRASEREDFLEIRDDVDVNDLDRELEELAKERESASIREDKRAEIVDDFIERMERQAIDPIQIGSYDDCGLSNPLTGRRLASFTPKMQGWAIQDPAPRKRARGLVVTEEGQVFRGPTLYYCDPAESMLTEAGIPLRFIWLKLGMKKFAFVDNSSKSHIPNIDWLWTEVTEANNFVKEMARFIAENSTRYGVHDSKSVS